MLVLIAESKTMAREVAVPADEFSINTPSGEKEADLIMKFFSDMNAEKVSELTRLPLSLSSKMRAMAFNFPDKSTGNHAIMAFTGVVFDALSYSTLSQEAKVRCENSVRLISSLYGWLRPADYIKTYRLDYTSKIPLGNDDIAVASSFWRKNVTIQLGHYLKNNRNTQILNLLPSDASKCIDWKLIKNFAKVWKVDFTDALKGTTPDAGKLKKMRGLLLRQILEEKIENIDTLKQISSDHYLCEGTLRYPDHLHFMC